MRGNIWYLIFNWWRKFSVILIILIIATIIIFDKSSNFASSLRVNTHSIFTPIFKFLSQNLDKALNLTNDIKNIASLRPQNTALLQENNLLKIKLKYLKQIEEENKSLKTLLNFVDEPEFKYITARIIIDSKAPYMRTISINAGTLHGVKVGQVVVNSSGLIGRVISVANKVARILLITDFNSKVPILTVESRELAIAAGDNSNELDILYLSKNHNLKLEELVVTTGDGEFFPPGIVVGKITKVNNTFKITTFVEWNKIDYVSLIENVDK